ncbi:tetratricopeptide repeat protein [Geobacter sp. OR-1]|uniref:tetratricopeptide repeat protein n=1 Tax=Geobacter sp. OR-1 TaxID=1266765 RepID=UPI0005434939|nr:tetratricopeptide repeat protein [Geobacter sp. OR-1]GAM10020.1 tetratricopeptide repeat protein [Geobacter sp. OR-1]
MRRFARLFLLIAAVMTILPFRFDLSRYRMERGYQSYQRGDMDGALANWSLLGDRNDAAFNRGTALFRKGETDRAIQEFRGAVRSNDPALRQRALYNLGTVLLTSSAKKTVQLPEKVQRDLEEATSVLENALRLDPSDAAARQNEAIARSALAEVRRLLAAKGQGERIKTDGSRSGRQDDRSDTNRKGEQSDKPGRPGKATNEGDTKGKSRQAPDMTREQADRLLNDARGRETLRSAISAGSKPSKPTPPEKDW